MLNPSCWLVLRIIWRLNLRCYSLYIHVHIQIYVHANILILCCCIIKSVSLILLLMSPRIKIWSRRNTKMNNKMEGMRLMRRFNRRQNKLIILEMKSEKIILQTLNLKHHCQLKINYLKSIIQGLINNKIRLTLLMMQQHKISILAWT